MTDHKATPEQWAEIEKAKRWDDPCSCVLVELRARVEALEAAQHPTIKESLTVAPAPAGSLVERVAAARARAGIDQEDRAVLARWGRPAIKPIPVSERLPGPEDCDEDGVCWWWSRYLTAWCLCWAADGDHEEWTHWLPHHALLVPEQTP
jgi:hypothetical protein